MMFGWFGTVIGESESGLYNDQVDRSFRMGHELVHLLRGDVLRRVLRRAVLRPAAVRCRGWAAKAAKLLTNVLLWPDFESAWPTNGPARVGGLFETDARLGVCRRSIPLILLSSGRDHHHRRTTAAQGRQPRQLLKVLPG
ncbi:MAG: hypothetical protein MZV65_41355 [Chromatiales bacterium]|nr:hypothetical protein [Chromatiales bacterium]